MARDPAGPRDRHDAATYRLEPVSNRYTFTSCRPGTGRPRPRPGPGRGGHEIARTGHLPSLGRNPAREHSPEPTITAAPVV